MIRDYKYTIVPTLLLAATSVSAQDKPNILIIHTDEQNFRTLGCYRELLSEDQAYVWGKGIEVETPHIDRLAAEGVLFRNCYATTPVSSPSRASFLTGLYPQNAGMYTNDMVLNKEAVTFAEVLRDNGYATGYIGKLHLNGKGRPEWQPQRDFGFTDNRYMYNRGHWKKIVETESGPEFLINEPVGSTDSLSFTTDFLTNRTLEFIEQHQGEPFCCLLSLPDPHSANLVRAPYDSMYVHLNFQQPRTACKDTTGLPAWSYGGNLRQDRMEDMAQYFGMIKCIDDNIGRILNKLEKEGLLNNTLIVFTSDHGDMCGEHGLINKGVPLEGSSKVPFIIRYPSKMAKGIHTDHVMSVADFTPSLLSFLNVGTTVSDGRDLSALLRGEPLPASISDITFMRATTQMIKSDWDESATANRFLWLSAVTPRFKLTYSENEGDIPWLTDLEKDLDELVNCYFDPAYKEIVKDLNQQLTDYIIRYNDPRIDNPHIQKQLKIIAD